LKFLLNRIFLSITLLLCAYINASSSILVLEEYKLFDCQEDSTGISEISEHVIQKIDSLMLAELGEKYKGNPDIYKVYSFSEIPCVTLFKMVGGHNYNNRMRYGYQFILFNACDSSICHFGGNTLQFSNVIRSYIPKNLEEDHVIRLLNFFLNTIHEYESYYILNSVDDFIKIFIYEGSYYGPNGEYNYPPMKDYEKWLGHIEEIVGPIRISKEDDSLLIEFYTWLWAWETVSRNKIDLWKFKVTKERIELLDRKTLIEDIGDEW